MDDIQADILGGIRWIQATLDGDMQAELDILIYLIPFIGVSTATFGRLLGGAGLNSLLGSAGGGLLGGSGLGSGPGIGSGKGLGGIGGGAEDNYISIIDQLGPGKVIERGTLRKRIPKSGGIAGGSGHGTGGAISGGGYSAAGGAGISGDGHGTIVNIYGDPTGGFGGGFKEIQGGLSGGISNDDVTVIRVIHEYVGSHGGSYAGGYTGSTHSAGSNAPVTVYKIIESSSYGGGGGAGGVAGVPGAYSNAISSGSYSNTIHSSGSGNGGWAPITGQKGW
ncbi:uncharacterized protein LOC129605148 [Condylostylus longicornis]|uniref:uncharacterized protein LOC129605148 n=1 Tax=Condylostylus longicornis TaxID=2530218 RepID=UPI00244DAF77|nr:uncharacterized protein LOC129605148 [Condylostylus longicornis]